MKELPSKVVMSNYTLSDVMRMTQKELDEAAIREYAKLKLLEPRYAYLDRITSGTMKALFDEQYQLNKLKEQDTFVSNKHDRHLLQKKIQYHANRLQKLQERLDRNRRAVAKVAKPTEHITNNLKLLKEEDLLRTKRRVKEYIAGGISSGMSPKAFDARAIKQGIEVELEHTPSRRAAREIASDHIAELGPHYYDELKKMEKKLEYKKAK